MEVYDPSDLIELGRRDKKYQAIMEDKTIVKVFMVKGYHVYLTAHKVNARGMHKQRAEKMSLRFKLRTLFPYGRSVSNTRWEVSPQLTINELLISRYLQDAAIEWATGEWHTVRDNIQQDIEKILED